MTNTALADAQVLVVGAGPTGLLLAAQLLARGIDTRVIDKGSAPAPHSRALGVHAGSLELLDTMGLADAFVARGFRCRGIDQRLRHSCIEQCGPGAGPGRPCTGSGRPLRE